METTTQLSERMIAFENLIKIIKECSLDSEEKIAILNALTNYISLL